MKFATNGRSAAKPTKTAHIGIRGIGLVILAIA